MRRMKRTKQDFFNKIAIKDQKTVDAYQKRISKWEEFLITRKLDSDHIPNDTDDALDLLQLFVNWYSMEAINHRTKQMGHSPNTVWNFSSSIRKYLFYRGCPITKDDTQEHLELPSKLDKELHGLSLDEILKILDDMNYDYRTLFLCQLSSGIRIGEMMQLRKRHLIFDKERIMVKIPAKIAKFNRARTTFFSKEAGNMLKTILKRIEGDDLIFTSNSDPHIAEVSKGNRLREHLDSIGLDMKYEDTGNYQINTHSFRAYFITKVSRHDENLSKLFAGEKGYLLSYDRLSEDEKLENYLDFEKDLLIYDSTRKDEEIKKLRIANTKLADQAEEIKEQEKRIKNLERMYLGNKSIL